MARRQRQRSTGSARAHLVASPASRLAFARKFLSHSHRSVAVVEELVSLKKCLGRALVYLVLEIGALCGVPMRPDEIEKLMKIADRRVTHVKRNQKGDVT